MKILTEAKTLFKSTERCISKNSPAILTGMAVVGVIGSVYFTGDATIKAVRLVDEKNKNREEPLTKTEVVKICWKLYVPATISAGEAIICAIGANSINAKRNVALASAYALSTDALKAYKNKTEEVVGKTKMQKIRDEIFKEKVEKDSPENKTIIMTGKGNVLCCESLSSQYFRSTVEGIDSAINRANEELLNEGYISLNGVYDYLGLKSTKLGETVGWEASDGLITVSYASDLSNEKEPVLLVEFDGFPKRRPW